MPAEREDIVARLDRQKSLHIGILVFPDVEVLDFAGPFEVFSVAARMALRRPEFSVAPFKVSTVGAARAPVMARHGLQVLPHHGFDDVPPIDLLIVPGGIVTQPAQDADTLDWIRRTSETAALTASVCTGAFLLAKVGLLEGLTVTTHWEDLPDLRTEFPGLNVVENVPYVDQGGIVTSAGISAGIGMSLHLVRRILGEELAVRTARQMQYDWAP
ncbi:MAG TPA: DJ-1/PfpI family protein [Paucimonas sp.]|nr:DJ-1/PfpI family protein [Paucimonas sp.]